MMTVTSTEVLIKKLFVYGSLMNEEVLERLLKCHFTTVRGSLRGYKRVKVVGEVYPAMSPDSDNMVEGKLISGITAKQLRCLDQFEGSFYQRLPVIAVGEDNMQYHCEAYVCKPEYYHLLSNDCWCNEYFRIHHMESFITDCCNY